MIDDRMDSQADDEDAWVRQQERLMQSHDAVHYGFKAETYEEYAAMVEYAEMTRKEK
jgi:hypothetical protein